MNHDVNAVFREIEKNEAKHIRFWEDICNIETVSSDKVAVDGLVDFIQVFANEEGFAVRRTPFEKCGDFLTIDMNEGAEKGYMFLAHMDTVHVKGKFGYPPVKIDGNKMIGPGVIDCKGGIAVALLAMKALKTVGYAKHLRLILTSDEEVSNSLGGGSDSAYTQLAGVPSVCAVGACGDYCHTVNEYAEIDSLVKRAKLLAATTIS